MRKFNIRKQIESMSKGELRELSRAAFSGDTQGVIAMIFSIGTCCGSCRFSVGFQDDLVCTKRNRYKVQTYWVCRLFDVDPEAPVYSDFGVLTVVPKMQQDLEGKQE